MKKRKLFLIGFIIILIIMFIINIVRNVLIIKNINKLSKEFLENPENTILSVIAADGYDESEDYIDDSIDYDEDIPYYEEIVDNTDTTVNEISNSVESENVIENITENTQIDSSNTIDTSELDNFEDENYDIIENESDDEELEEETILDDGYEETDISKVKIPEKISFYDIALQIIKSDEYFYKIKINKSTVYVNKNTGLIQKEELENNKIITYLIED